MMTMMTKLTLFKNLFDNKTDKKMEFTSFDKLEELLYNISKQPGSKFDIKGSRDQKCSSLISPAVFKEGTTRKNDNVVEWAGWCCVDVDDFEFEGDLKEELNNRFGHWRYICYSTASSKVDTPKFRVVFPLKYNVPADQIRHFWFALNTELDSIGDRQTKDLARMYYVPAQYPDANNFIFSNDGHAIDPADLMAKHKYVERSNNTVLDRLPPAIRDAILKEKRAGLTNTDVSWTNFNDCPFFPRHLVEEYRTISKTGWYNLSYRMMVSCAMKALGSGYPITSNQIAIMMRQLDLETGGWYKNRPLEREAQGAIDFAMKSII